MSSCRFFTNDGENTLLKKFAGVFEHNPDIERFDALVGYLRSSGYFALQPHLAKVPPIRILVGIESRLLARATERTAASRRSGQTLAETRQELEKTCDCAISERSRRRNPPIRHRCGSKARGIRAHPTKRLHAKSTSSSRQASVNTKRRGHYQFFESDCCGLGKEDSRAITSSTSCCTTSMT